MSDRKRFALFAAHLKETFPSGVCETRRDIDGPPRQAYTRSMALIRVAVDYIREHRADSSDTSIRAALAGQGFSVEIMDQAFAEAGARLAAAPSVPLPVTPSTPKRRIWPWMLWSIAGTFILAVSGLLVLGSRSDMKSRKPKLLPEVVDYRPERLSDPAHLPSFLPDGLIDEDASADYERMFNTTDGFMAGAPGAAVPPPTAAQVALMDSALRKKRSTLGIRLAHPLAKASIAAFALKAQMLMSLSEHLRARIKDADARGDWAQADFEARRLTLLGWHNAQDWEPATQSLGLRTMLGGIMYVSVAADKRGKRDAAYRVVAQKAALDLAAYAPETKVFSEIDEESADPAKLHALMARISNPAKRRAYAWYILASVASNWSAEEAFSGRPAPEREAFMRGVAALDDPNLRILAPNFAAMMKETASAAESFPAEKRAEMLDALNKSLAPKFSTNF